MRYFLAMAFLFSGALQASSFDETGFEQVPCKKKKKKKKGGCGCGHITFKVDRS